MDAIEKAQRLMLVTDIKFRMDNLGNIVESDEPISRELIDQAVNMTREEFNRRVEDQRRSIMAAKLKNDCGMIGAYLAYQLGAPETTFDQFARMVIDAAEDS